METAATEHDRMEKLARVWVRFRQWPVLGQRAAMAAACYAVWLLSIGLYCLGLQSVAEFLGFGAAFAFFFAIGGAYVLRGAFFLLVWWLRLF